MTTCFVIMGFATKKIPNTNIEVNLDDTYNYLIKPTLIEMDLVAVNCDERHKHAYRCDEIFTTQAINETFTIKYLYGRYSHSRYNHFKPKCNLRTWHETCYET